MVKETTKNKTTAIKPSSGKYFYAIGRRKSAVAQARIWKGNGDITVNGKKLEDYFTVPEHQYKVKRPFTSTKLKNEYNVSLKVFGGGKLGQADASSLAIARALIVQDESRKSLLRKAGLVTRDDRVKERKKFGLKRARRAPQFSKR